MNIDISVLLPVIGALVAVVNIVTQVLKKVTWDKIPTNVVVLLLSVALTEAAFLAYCQIEAVAVTWYMVVAAVVAGFAVAYAVRPAPPEEKERYALPGCPGPDKAGRYRGGQAAAGDL